MNFKSFDLMKYSLEIESHWCFAFSVILKNFVRCLPETAKNIS